MILRRRIHKVFLIILMGIFLMGCGKSEQGNETTVTTSPKGGDDKFVVKAYPTVYPTSQCVTWLLPFYSGLSDENRNEINRILYEKGLDCQIRFVKTSTIIGTDFEYWLQEYEKANPMDIINSGAWQLGDVHQIRFVENNMVKLNDFLEKPEAESLWCTYTEDEWNSVSIDKNLYVIPEAAFQLEESYGVETGTYVAVNKSYLDYFADFDGTYISLRSIYDKIGDDNLHIVIDGLPGGASLYALLGYSALYYEQLPYCDKTNLVVNIVDGSEAKDFLKQLYIDMLSGLVINRQMAGNTSKQVLAHIHGRGSIPQEGFQEFLISSRLYDFNCAGKYGVSVNSTQKELAEQILSVCLSDSEILCQLYPGIDVKTIENRTAILEEQSASRLAGIRLEFTEEQIKRLSKFENHYMMIMNDMYLQRGDGSYMLNPDFDVEKEWEKLVKEAGPFNDLCESANEQIQKWLQEQ